MLKVFKINTKIYVASELDLSGEFKNNLLLIEICKKFSADTYISGAGGKNYLDLGLFKENGIEVKFNDFLHPIYKQMFEPFIPNLSAIDLIFNYGDKSREALIK